MNAVLFKKQVMVVAIVGLALGLSVPAFAQTTLQVIPSSAPNAFGSPSWAGYSANALNSLQNNLGNIGSRATDPTAYEIAGPIVQPGDFMVTTFNSWQGVAGPLAAPFTSEEGNRMHFGLHASSATPFDLAEVTFSISSSDPANSLSYVDDLSGCNFNGTTRIGLNWGPDGIKGTSDDILYTAGNVGNDQTLVNELFYVGAGNALWPGGSDPNPGNPAGGAQAAIDDTTNYIMGNAPFAITGSYSILGNTGSATVTVIPEPATISLLAMALGGLMLIRKRK
jgi:hypothetical protein